ncbi:hypothetical protein SKA34_11905 [Photobacterium sp. SKA34]|nr:hypothetical protein SKA34_11905 [Photobacterium sp. SKA34]
MNKNEKKDVTRIYIFYEGMKWIVLMSHRYKKRTHMESFVFVLFES